MAAALEAKYFVGAEMGNFESMTPGLIDVTSSLNSPSDLVWSNLIFTDVLRSILQRFMPPNGCNPFEIQSERLLVFVQVRGRCQSLDLHVHRNLASDSSRLQPEHILI